MAKIAHHLHLDLISEMPTEQVFQKHVVDGSSYFFGDVLKAPNSEYELRYDLANALQISINDIVIVGSAKLGFSLKTFEFNKFDFRYENTGNPRDRSDIDVAVVNRKYYDQSIEQIYHLSRHFDRSWIRENWRINAFHNQPTDLCGRYALYVAKGWLRPDYVPSVFFDQWIWRGTCDAWRKKLNLRRISVGFYSDWLYLKHYHMDNLDRLKAQLRGLEINNV